MNLHIVSDSKFSNTFYNNLNEAGLLNNNRIIVRTNEKTLRYVTHDLPFAAMYSSRFDSLVGDTIKYDKVFIHQLSPLQYRWMARNSFRELNWMIWGGDLYNLPFVKYNFYEPLTYQYQKKHPSRDNLLYLLKVYLTSMPFRKKAYSKINHVLTWMQSEYQFAKHHIPSLKAEYQFFFYENQVPYQQLDAVLGKHSREKSNGYKIIVGNSGTVTNNHLDVIYNIAVSGMKADLFIPISYGDRSYINFLRRNVSFYKNGEIAFIDKFMAFDEYVQFLGDADALVMNHIRPQGYGNIFMMMYLGKPVFLNPKNISLPDLTRYGFTWHRSDDFSALEKTRDYSGNREAVNRLLSHDHLLSTYTKLFS